MKKSLLLLSFLSSGVAHASFTEILTQGESSPEALKAVAYKVLGEQIISSDQLAKIRVFLRQAGDAHISNIVNSAQGRGLLFSSVAHHRSPELLKLLVLHGANIDEKAGLKSTTTKIKTLDATAQEKFNLANSIGEACRALHKPLLLCAAYASQDEVARLIGSLEDVNAATVSLAFKETANEKMREAEALIAFHNAYVDSLEDKNKPAKITVSPVEQDDDQQKKLLAATLLGVVGSGVVTFLALKYFTTS